MKQGLPVSKSEPLISWITPMIYQDFNRYHKQFPYIIYFNFFNAKFLDFVQVYKVVAYSPKHHSSFIV